MATIEQITGFSEDWWDGVDALRKFLIDRFAREKENHEKYTVNRFAREVAEAAGEPESKAFKDATKSYAAAQEKMDELERAYDDILRFGYRDQFEEYAKKRKADKAQLK